MPTPACAAVAPKLLYPDGRLQEAGSIVWRDARVRNYGDGDVPNRPEYLFRRTVDYASAACLLVRRSAFVEVGGFDPRFAPMYCEDVDLCLALAKRHGRVVYQPRSVVEHVRGASAIGWREGRSDRAQPAPAPCPLALACWTAARRRAGGSSRAASSAAATR